MASGRGELTGGQDAPSSGKAGVPPNQQGPLSALGGPVGSGRSTGRGALLSLRTDFSLEVEEVLPEIAEPPHGSVSAPA